MGYFVWSRREDSDITKNTVLDPRLFSEHFEQVKKSVFMLTAQGFVRLHNELCSFIGVPADRKSREAFSWGKVIVTSALVQFPSAKPATQINRIFLRPECYHSVVDTSPDRAQTPNIQSAGAFIAMIMTQDGRLIYTHVKPRVC